MLLTQVLSHRLHLNNGLWTVEYVALPSSSTEDDALQTCFTEDRNLILCVAGTPLCLSTPLRMLFPVLAQVRMLLSPLASQCIAPLSCYAEDFTPLFCFAKNIAHPLGPWKVSSSSLENVSSLSGFMKSTASPSGSN